MIPNDETAELKQLMKQTVNEVLDERETDDLSNLEHYLQHEWIKTQMRKQRRLSEVAREAAVRWGTVTGIMALGYGAYEMVKNKLGGIL